MAIHVVYEGKLIGVHCVSKDTTGKVIILIFNNPERVTDFGVGCWVL